MVSAKLWTVAYIHLIKLKRRLVTGQNFVALGNKKVLQTNAVPAAQKGVLKYKALKWLKM